jgi:hypothetical protein
LAERQFFPCDPNSLRYGFDCHFEGCRGWGIEKQEQVGGDRVKVRNFGAAVVCLVCGFSTAGFGASVTFSGPTAFTSDAALNQTGTVLTAAQFSISTPVTVTPAGGSAITFVRGTTGAPSTAGVNIDVSNGGGTATGTGNNSFYTNGGAGANSGNANFNTVLDGAAFDGNPNVVTISGLTNGTQYNVQIFVADTRACCNGRTVSFTNTNGTGTSAVATEGTPSYFIGTFTADATQQAFQSSTGSNNINALVVRAVPEPMSIGLFAVGAMGLLGRRRR